MPRPRPRHWCLLLIACLLSVPASTEPMYRWVDASGRVHFGDRPPATANAKPVVVRVNTYQGTSIEALSAVFTAPQTNTVVMYSTVWCGVCKKAKAYFAAKRIAYQDFDVETSDKGRRDFKQLGGRGVPIILFAGQRMNGFSPAVFEGAAAVEREVERAAAR